MPTSRVSSAHRVTRHDDSGMDERTLHTFARLGHVARRSTLTASGISRAKLESAVGHGELLRPLRGWYATPLADIDQLRAVQIGARIGCVTALRRWGVWGGNDGTLHLHANPTASRLRDARPMGSRIALPHPSLSPARAGELAELLLCDDAEPTVHWHERYSEAASLDWIVGPLAALAQAIRCQPEEQALACIDSALHEGVVSPAEWAKLTDALPRRRRSIIPLVDSRADSGVESIVRLRLVRLGYAVEPQVRVPGVGTIDMVINGRVAIEVDGDAYHSTLEQRRRDRMRTTAALALGLPTLRIGTEQLGEQEWPLVLSGLERLDSGNLSVARRAVDL
jgi:very-short-patch-repair endonuclease